jgi:transposase
MKKLELIIGIDVSKLTLDLFILGDEVERHLKINNKQKVIASFLRKIKKEFSNCKFIIAMENTGYYNWPFYDVFDEIPSEIYVINPFHLKRSLGLVRGKNDYVDAKRIANFVVVHKNQLKPTIIPRKELRLLQALIAQRKRLVDTRTRCSVSLKELKQVADKDLFKDIETSNKELIENINQQIKNIEQSIGQLISSDKHLSDLFQRITTVQGVGKVLTWNLLVKTNEFKSINNPRKLACYAGVVPFEYQSGSSIFKKPKVSYMADKSLKKLLHMSALRVIQLPGDLQDYYLRKTDEGKSKMTVINALRNKLVLRICAVVNQRKNYQVYLDMS